MPTVALAQPRPLERWHSHRSLQVRQQVTLLVHDKRNFPLVIILLTFWLRNAVWNICIQQAFLQIFLEAG